MNTLDLLDVSRLIFRLSPSTIQPARRELLARCLTPNCAIWGHSHVFAGHLAISDKIAKFHINFPDCRLVSASGLMTFDNIVRAANATSVGMVRSSRG
jgi:hypothetical protein